MHYLGCFLLGTLIIVGGYFECSLVGYLTEREHGSWKWTTNKPPYLLIGVTLQFLAALVVLGGTALGCAILGK